MSALPEIAGFLGDSDKEVVVDAAKAALREAIEFLTGEENITTPEQLDNWYNDPSGDNRDDEDAEEFYGP